MTPTRITEERRAEDRRIKIEPYDGVERRHCDDRRHDIPSRERIEWLEVRYRRVTELLFASMVTTLVVTTLGLVFYGKQADRIEDEQSARAADSRERIDQGCKISEGKQLKDVTSLKATYKYLLALPPKQRRKGINGAIFAQLSSIEHEAEIDDAPAYCDQPNVGLPEPDPVVPERPAELRRAP